MRRASVRWVLQAHPVTHMMAYRRSSAAVLKLTRYCVPCCVKDLYESLHDIWDEMVRVEVKVWAKFNAYWLKKSLPIIAIRYEDLVLHPEVSHGPPQLPLWSFTSRDACQYPS